MKLTDKSVVEREPEPNQVKPTVSLEHVPVDPNSSVVMELIESLKHKIEILEARISVLENRYTCVLL